MSFLSQSAFHFYLQSLPDKEVIDLDYISGDLSIGIEDITISDNYRGPFTLKPPVCNRKELPRLNFTPKGECIYRTVFFTGEIEKDEVELLKMKYYEHKLEFLKLMKSIHPNGTKLIFMQKRPGTGNSLKLLDSDLGYELILYGVCQSNLKALHDGAKR